jgi:WD40 repeat protein
MALEDPVTDAEEGHRSLLTGAEEPFGFGGGPFERPAAAAALAAGLDLGGVTIVRLLGQGGMGCVYEARQDAPRRTVAVKVMRLPAGCAADVPAFRRRFEAEAETLARLRHPGIAQVHTCGTASTPDGPLPFFVMELVADARPITRFAAVHGLSLRQRVELFARVCAAVAHGHEQGLVHRDLKPGNILVSGAGEPKVIDFGVATWAGTAPSGDPEIVGTLRYMSPEQLEGGAAPVDARSDVYSLGLVLHELVVGGLPYDLGGKSLTEAARLVGGDAAPGTAVVERAAVAEAGRDDARALAVIVAKCLERAPADRYVHAGELAADVTRWLEGRSILARPPTPLESLRRFARRHPASTVAGLASLGTLVAAAVAVAALWLHAGRQRRAAEEARTVAEERAAEARSELYFSHVLLAAEARDRDNLAEARHLLGSARSLTAGGGSAEPLELACLDASLDEAVEVLPGHDGTVTAVGWSSDGRTVATGDAAGGVRIWAGEGMGDSGRTMQRVQAHAGTVWAVAFSPDGDRVASAGADGAVRIHDVRFGGSVAVADAVVNAGDGDASARHRGAVYDVAFSGDGTRLVTAARDGSVRIWDAASGKQLQVLRRHAGTVFAACFSPDDALVATAGDDGDVRLCEADTGSERALLRGHTDRVFHVAFAPDGLTLATASEDGTARIWDLQSSRETARLEHPLRVNGVAFLGSGDEVVTAAGDGLLRVWNVATGTESRRLRGHAAAIWSVASVPRTADVVTGSADGTARVWDAAESAAPVVGGGDSGRILCAAYAPDGGLLATGHDDSQVRLWDGRSLTARGELAPAIGRVNGVAFSPDGGLVAAACDDGAVFIWDAVTRSRVAARQPHDKRVYAAAFSPDGRLLATASEDRTARLWHVATGDASCEPLVHPRRVFCVAFSPDGAVVATACEDRAVRLWDAATGREVRRLGGHSGPVNWAAFSGDGSRLATASSDRTVRLWDTAGGAEVAVLRGPARQIWKVDFAPDSRRLAAVSADGTAQLWETATGRSALVLRGHADQVWALDFAPDGRSLVTGSWDGTARAWGVSQAELVGRRAGRRPPPRVDGTPAR